MTKATRWAWIVSLVAVTGSGLVLFFLLSVSTSNRALFERHYIWLFWVNATVAVLLAVVIAIAVTRLFVRVRRGRFGSRLLLRLVGIFAFVGVVPGVLIYTVSYQFVSRSIESWFDVKVEGALDAGLNLGRGTLDALVDDLAKQARLAAEHIGQSQPEARPIALERLREQLSANDVAIVGANGQILVTVGSLASMLAPERPSLTLLRRARNTRVASQLEGLDDDATTIPAAKTEADFPPRIRVLASIPSANFALGEQERYLLVTQLLPRSLTTNALAVQAAYSEYQQRALAREGLRRMYIGTLTLVLILAVFGALLLAVTLGNQLARPLLVLAEGVRQVAHGDLTPKAVFASRDELGGLTRSFADMTEQLSDARSQVQRSVAQLERAHANLQTILDNLTAGVIVFDHDGLIDTVNPGATRILRLPLSAYRGQRLEAVPGLEAFAQSVSQRFELQSYGRDPGEREHWQDAFELQTAPEHEKLTLLVRGAYMPQNARLMVFDDITEVVSAQRTQAWSEVARRLAHEIKNPLTPIQLSAERLQQKLEAKLEGVDQAMLTRAVGTIVNQVQAMKQLVNEFRDYARLPAAEMKPLDLNALVGEVLALYATAQESGHLRAECTPTLPAIMGDATQLRQVVHNLVQNALDAVADQPNGLVCVCTEVAATEQGELRAVRLLIVDNGPGFSDKVLKRAFEPYVTTKGKGKGTGLGLAVVKKIADEHSARIRIGNLSRDVSARSVDGAGAPEVVGAQVSLSFSMFPPTDVPIAASAEAEVGAHEHS
ncbi:MAG: ATP-binding protein [Burkholderiaceae bacterium]|nr:ATP-binding protein [Burkholderiaceae bacterium]